MHLGPRTFVVHNNSCRVERVEVCRRLSLSKSLESTVRAFAFYIPGEYTQSTKYIYSTSAHHRFFGRHVGTSSTRYVTSGLDAS